MFLSPKDLLCSECEGKGEVKCDCDCPHCDNCDDCDDCQGTGFNCDVVDLERYIEAVNALNTPIAKLKDGAVLVGAYERFCQAKRVLAKDFLLEGVDE